MRRRVRLRASRKCGRVTPEESSPRWEEDALGFLIAPVARDEFLANILRAGRPDHRPRRAPPLCRTADRSRRSNHFIASADLRDGMIDLTSQKHRITRESFIDDRGRVSSVAVAEHFMRGADDHPAAPARFAAQPRRILPLASRRCSPATSRPTSI
jgi:hypothetical protein